MKHYGLIGYPLHHSFSKKYFTEKFRREAIDADYSLFELPEITHFETLTEEREIDGLNVTIPYKERIIPYLDALDETAATIGAVNVIQFKKNGNRTILKGYNSDAVGFWKSIKPHLKKHHNKALILGSGGASKAIIYALHKYNIETTIVSRSHTNGDLTYDELDKSVINTHLIIINATPLGTYPDINSCPDIPYEYLTHKHLLFDLVYNPAETLFLKKGKILGTTILNGMEMLIQQAETAYQIFTQK